MTVKEAIEWQKAFMKTYNGMPEDTDEACEMAIEALQKQEPRKPRKNNGEVGIMFWKMQTYTCPKCGNQCLTPWMNERNRLNYCWDCGQRINWKEQEKGE